jgi:hypothetical protein
MFSCAEALGLEPPSSSWFATGVSGGIESSLFTSILSSLSSLSLFFSSISDLFFASLSNISCLSLSLRISSEAILESFLFFFYIKKKKYGAIE